MKNEFMARAMTQINEDLITEAEESVARRAKILTPNLARQIYRWGSIASCLALLIGVLLVSGHSGNKVMLYGETVTDTPRSITEYMPRAVTYSVDPALLTEVSLPLEFEFKRSTELSVNGGKMIVLGGEGDTLFEGSSYTAKGEVSVCLVLPPDVTNCIITTDRGYNIVLAKDVESELWYVNIDK